MKFFFERSNHKMQWISETHYRVTTLARSVVYLWGLPKEDFQSFMESYALFEADRVTNNERLIVDYYRVLNHLCSIGQVEKMYIPPLLEAGKGIWHNQVEFETQMMRDIGLEPGMNVLEIGSGRGRVAAHVAQATQGSMVTGVNIDTNQVKNAREFVAQSELSQRVRFVEQSYNDVLPFPDNSFDAVYEIQALTYAKDYAALFKELHRVMKPGAKISVLDWFLYDKFDSGNAEHQDMLQRTKKLIGAVRDPLPQEMAAAMEGAGFTIVKNANASVNDVQYPLIDQADKYFTALQRVVNFLVAIWVLPFHFKPLLERLTLDGQVFVEGDKLGLWTSVHQIVAVKEG